MNERKKKDILQQIELNNLKLEKLQEQQADTFVFNPEIHQLIEENKRLNQEFLEVDDESNSIYNTLPPMQCTGKEIITEKD